MKSEKTTLVATMTQYAMMCARQEEAHQELRNFIKKMNERQGKLLAMMVRKQNLMSQAPKLFGKGYFMKSGTWTKGSLERKLFCWRKAGLEDMLAERRSAEVEEERDTADAGGTAGSVQASSWLGTVIERPSRPGTCGIGAEPSKNEKTG